MTESSPTKPAQVKGERAMGEITPPPKVGRVVLAGSRDWANTGRKGKAVLASGESLEHSDPGVYGPTAHLNITRVISHCTACHSVILDVDGNAYTFGRNEKGQLGDGSLIARSDPYKVTIVKGAANTPIIHAAVGRGHTLLVAADGRVFAAGDNKMGQCGDSDPKEHKSFVQVGALKSVKVVQVSAGSDFSLALTEGGEVYSWGSPQYGQTGCGATGEHIVSAGRSAFYTQEPKVIPGLKGVTITSISCGANHCMAIDAEGGPWVWGCGGYSRLGLNNTPPKDILVPTELWGFKERKNPARAIAAGPTCSMIVDDRQNLHVCGMWKKSGDGGQSSPWMYPKFFIGLQGWHIDNMAIGGNTLFCLADDCVVSWGQACNYGELAHGSDKPKSATNAVKAEAFDDMGTFDVACGLGHTLVLVDVTKGDDVLTSKFPVIGDLQQQKKGASSADAGAGKKRKGSSEGTATKPKAKKASTKVA